MTAERDYAGWTWTEDRLAEAVAALARAAGLAGRGGAPESGFATEAHAAPVAERIADAARRSGAEAWPLAAPYRDVGRLLAAPEPALLRISGEDRWLALLGGGSRVRLLTPDAAVVTTPASRLADELRAPLDRSAAAETEALIERAGVPPRRRPRAVRALLRERLGGEPCADGWALRPQPGTAAARQLHRAGVLSHLGRLVTAHTLSWFLLLASWWVLGRGVLDGRLDPGWLTAWVLLLASLIPLQALALWSEGAAALTAGALLKRRLLAGSLRLEPEEIRHQGTGELLGRVIEAERIEDLALGGGFAAVLSAIEIVLAAAVLALGAGGGLHVLLLAAWVAALGLAGGRLLRRLRDWAGQRIEMTHRLVERLLGHRTRLVQEPRRSWHGEEDQELAEYVRGSRRLDRLMPRIESFAGRGWLLAALLALAPALLTGRASAADFAVALGGILLAARGLEGVAAGLSGLTAASVAWRQVAPLYEAATRESPVGSPAVLTGSPRESEGGAVLTARGLAFRYPGRGQKALDGCNLELRAGDRVLLSGRSGSGKSTLISLLAALRRPQSGLVLLHGADLHGWGTRGWHRRVAAAPQFHENHLFAAPLAFNLLLGRAWPPSPEDLADAAEVCDELGLGDLVASMPAGLMQPVGETGWRLSHGEASRVYLARALLQEPDVVLLDESFAALDPASLAAALACARRRARTLVVAAHH